MYTRTSGHVDEYYGPDFSCTESTLYPEKKKRLELNLWISVKNIWILFFWVGLPCMNVWETSIFEKSSFNCWSCGIIGHTCMYESKYIPVWVLFCNVMFNESWNLGVMNIPQRCENRPLHLGHSVKKEIVIFGLF